MKLRRRGHSQKHSLPQAEEEMRKNDKSNAKYETDGARTKKNFSTITAMERSVEK